MVIIRQEESFCNHDVAKRDRDAKWEEDEEGAVTSLEE
jgi:hypothetical protein